MLRLTVLILALVGLMSLIPPTPNASALPDDQSSSGCLGLLRSALVRSGSTVTARDPETGEPIALDRSFNPGDFRGATGVDELLALFPWLARNRCVLPLPDLTSCIDFTSGNPCGDPDHDDYWNQQEWSTGSDSENAASTPEYALIDEQFGSNTCGDAVDNDLDGRTDNSDAGCRVTCEDFGHSDRCADPDGDGWLNYVEEMWGSDPGDPSSTPEGVGQCIDFDIPPPLGCATF